MSEIRMQNKIRWGRQWLSALNSESNKITPQVSAWLFDQFSIYFGSKDKKDLKVISAWK